MLPPAVPAPRAARLPPAASHRPQSERKRGWRIFACHVVVLTNFSLGAAGARLDLPLSFSLHGRAARAALLPVCRGRWGPRAAASGRETRGARRAARRQVWSWLPVSCLVELSPGPPRRPTPSHEGPGQGRGGRGDAGRRARRLSSIGESGSCQSRGFASSSSSTSAMGGEAAGTAGKGAAALSRLLVTFRAWRERGLLGWALAGPQQSDLAFISKGS